MRDDQAFTRRLLHSVFTVAAVAILIASLWVVRSALRIIYVSAIIAMGFSPLVGIIERKSSGKRRIPRTLPIRVIYLVIVAVMFTVGLMVIRPLIQGGELFLIRYRPAILAIEVDELTSHAGA